MFSGAYLLRHVGRAEESEVVPDKEAQQLQQAVHNT